MARCDGWRPASRRCGTPRWRWWPSVDAGLPGDHQALQAAGQWLLDEEIRGPGDWQVRRPGLTPAGWAFEFDNDGYPDIDDTAEVLLALRRARAAGEPDDLARRAAPAFERAIAWLTGMQSRDGGWGAFDADNTKRLVTKLPFCDFGEVIDPPSADVTAHTVEALCAEGQADSKAVRRGVAWLLRAQEPDGSWFGRWGANYVYGTGAVVPALLAAGVLPGKPVIRRAVTWLIGHQNPDGGWGEDLRSYTDKAWAGCGESTASQTAWALLALARGRRGRRHAQRRARRPVAGGDPAAGRELGRAAVHRDRIPRGLLYQLPPLSTGFPDQCARPLPGRCPVTKLTVCAPLGIEALAVRRGLRGAAAPDAAQVVRAGYGPARAAATAARLRAAGPPEALAVAGVGGGAAADLRTGDVVVATQASYQGTTVSCPSAPLLAGELRRAGLRVRVGPVQTVDRLLKPRDLGGVAADGAIAVDMESAPLLAAAGGGPAVVIRAISDTPARSVLSPGIVTGGIAALRSLRLAAPALARWAAACQPRRMRAGQPAVVLRGRGAGHRDRRARARPARRAGLRAQADRAQQRRRGRAGGQGRDLRGRAARGARRRDGGVLRARGVAGGAPGSRPARPAADRRHLPAGRQGARRGAQVRDRGLPGRVHRPRRARGGRGHPRRGARRHGAGGDPPRTWPACGRPIPARWPT